MGVKKQEKPKITTDSLDYYEVQKLPKDIGDVLQANAALQAIDSGAASSLRKSILDWLRYRLNTKAKDY